MIMRDGITTLPPNQWIALELGGCASCTGSSPSFEHTIEVISIAVLKLLQPAEAGAESSQHDANATGAENGCLTHRRYDPAGARGLTPHRSPAAPATPWGRHAPGRGLAGLFRF
jgi:hypothetical protein